MRFNIKQIVQTTLFSMLIPGMVMAGQGPDKIIAFGDSLSDNGNLYRYTTILHKRYNNVPIVPDAPYVNGHYTNGPTWVEALLVKIQGSIGRSTTLEDYAVSGAVAQSSSIDSSINAVMWPRHSVHDEIYNYLDKDSTEVAVNNRHLYTLWMGANDYLNLYIQGEVPYDLDSITTNVVAATINDIQALIQNVGAKKIMVLNLPDLGKTPLATIKGPETANALTQLSVMHNQKLEAQLDILERDNPNVKIIRVDILRGMNSLINDKAWRGAAFDNVTFPCYGQLPGAKMSKKLRKASYSIAQSNFTAPVCDKPHDYLFWDWIHPTTRVHQLIAEEAFSQLTA